MDFLKNYWPFLLLAAWFGYKWWNARRVTAQLPALRAAGATLVVTSGTATTADVLDSQGVFQGGVILPGLDLMRLSLARDTAQLPFSDGRFERTPRRTADAIQTGCLHAQLGAIERMFRLVAGEPGSLCLLNGGAAAALAPLLECPLREVDNLVLEGLVRMLGAD